LCCGGKSAKIETAKMPLFQTGKVPIEQKVLLVEQERSIFGQNPPLNSQDH